MRKLASTLAILALAAPAAALAHHGWDSYDSAKPIKLTAPLSSVAWVNPHSTAKVQYRGGTWDVVMAPLSRMEARGLTPAMISGKTVTLEGAPRSDGSAEMKIERLTVGGKAFDLRR